MYRLADLLSAMLDTTVALLAKTGFIRDRREPYLIVLEEGRFRLYRVGSGTPQIKAEGDAAGIGAALLPQLARSALMEVRIDARDCVVRTISLPRTSRNFAGLILRHQIERLTPWTLESVAYDWSQVNSPAEEFEVRIVAAAKARLQAETGRLEQAGLRLGRVGISSDPIEVRSPVDLLGRAGLAQERGCAQWRRQG